MGDLANFRGGFDECKQRLNSMQTVFSDFKQDFQALTKAKEKTKQEIRDFESLMAEYKASSDN